MAHDVFISYSKKDSEAAEKVCDALERGGIKCWIAPRDVPYGADYEESIVDAIASSRLLVLVLSSHSNASPHVKREIQCAYAERYNKAVVPVRIEEVEYNPALSYYLGSAQWLDASTPPLEQHLGRLVEHVRASLGRAGDEAKAVESPTYENPPNTPHAEPMQNAYYALKGTGDGTPVLKGTGDGRKPFPLALVGVGALVLIAVVVAIFAMRGGREHVNTPPTNNDDIVNSAPPTPQRTPTPTPAPTPKASPTPRITIRPHNSNLTQHESLPPTRHPPTKKP